MWANAEELGIENDLSFCFENDGILFFKQEDLKKIKEKVDIAETSFLKVGAKIHDISGYTTGLGLNVKDVFKMMKKKGAIRFHSDFSIEAHSECLKTLTSDILKAYPCEYLDKLESKLFFSISDKNESRTEVKMIDNPYSEENCKKKTYFLHIHFVK